MMHNDYSIPVTPVTSNAGGGFGGNGDALWIFALLVLFGGGGFGGGFGNRGGAVPEVSGFQLGELTGKVATKDSVQMLTNSIDNQFAQTNANLFNVREQLGNGLSTVTFELSNRINSVASLVSSCCCELKQEISNVRYDMSNFFAQSNANTTAGIQKILDTMASDKAMAQAQRISQLELQQALCGVVRYPNAITYNAGGTPFCNPCGCGC